MRKILLSTLILLSTVACAKNTFDFIHLSTEEAAAQCEQFTITMSIRLDRSSSDLDTWIKQLQPFHDQLKLTKSNAPMNQQEAIDLLKSISNKTEEAFLQNDARGEIEISSSALTDDQK